MIVSPPETRIKGQGSGKAFQLSLGPRLSHSQGPCGPAIPWCWAGGGGGVAQPTCPPLPPPQVLVLELNDEEAEHAVEQVEADLLQDQEGYRWKGHERLCARPGPVRFEPGFQPFVLVQCQPPAVVTSLALHSEWRLVAFGTSHGFGLFDHQQRRQVFVK